MGALTDILSSTLTWTDWGTDPGLSALLCDLQANILKGHGRDHTQNIFLSFSGMERDDIANLLRDLSFSTTSALEQLRDAEAFKATRVSGGRVVCVMLSIGGYRRLGFDDDRIPADRAFRAGMQERGRLDPMSFDSIPGFGAPSINDPEKTAWEQGGAWDPAKVAPDAMVLVADDSASLVGNSVSAFNVLFARHGARVLGIDTGIAQRRRQAGGHAGGEGIEHFGYVDGVSQPIFLTEDLPATPGAWSERFASSQFVVPDPGASESFACGSYFVYRKLEQNVKKFKIQESMLADALRLKGGEDRERAGALVVGRFEDGTPFALSTSPLAGVPTNDFSYDETGTQCPVRAHIRKTNPRDIDPDTNADERSRIMARRGITYGVRKPDLSDRPEGGVGLIFMAYMSNINEQFEFTQSAWANNRAFPFPVPPMRGVDPVIAQTANGADPDELRWTDPVSAHTTASVDFQQSVTLMGGEYFFAPSISFLQNAGRPPVAAV